MTKARDPVDLILSIPPIVNYSAEDRYRDFQRVFLGSEEGTRVLRWLLDETKLFSTVRPVSPVDVHLITFHEGERHVGMKLLQVLTVDPTSQPKPTTAKRTRE